eukprot:7900087-Pyramimonas_sp.AAC.1
MHNLCSSRPLQGHTYYMSKSGDACGMCKRFALHLHQDERRRDERGNTGREDLHSEMPSLVRAALPSMLIQYSPPRQARSVDPLCFPFMKERNLHGVAVVRLSPMLARTPLFSHSESRWKPTGAVIYSAEKWLILYHRM